VYYGVKKLVEMIKYYRTTPGLHWVDMNSLEFGDQLPTVNKSNLVDGRCDGVNKPYTYAYDIAGVRYGIMAAKELKKEDESDWTTLEAQLFEISDTAFSKNLGEGYGKYAMLWPCHIYPYSEGVGYDSFKKYGEHSFSFWPYFGPASAHQGLLA
jgi:hypothetical protein